MEVTTNGYKIPEDTDTHFFDYLEFDLLRLNDHTHDGVDSEPIPSSSVTRTSQSVDALNWEGNSGMYRKTIDIPNGFTFDDSNIHFLDPATGEQMYPKYVKINNSSFYLYSPYSNTVLEIWYG